MPKAPQPSDDQSEVAPQVTPKVSTPKRAKRIDGPEYVAPAATGPADAAEAPVLREVRMSTGAIRRDH